MYARMQCKAKSENFTHILGYQIWAVTSSPVNAQSADTSDPVSARVENVFLFRFNFLFCRKVTKY